MVGVVEVVIEFCQNFFVCIVFYFFVYVIFVFFWEEVVFLDDFYVIWLVCEVGLDGGDDGEQLV